jgi:hypothetical protein
MRTEALSGTERAVYPDFARGGFSFKKAQAEEDEGKQQPLLYVGLMSILFCTTCGISWYGEQRPACPRCLARSWQESNGLVQPHHDPTQLGTPLQRFRSVVPYEFSASAGIYLDHIAFSGSAYYCLYHREYFDFALVPPGMASGSAVYRGATAPTTALNGFLMAKAYQPEAHVYAEDLSRVEQRVTEGKYLPLETCAARGCRNLRVPPTDTCAEHSLPPLATTSTPG